MSKINNFTLRPTVYSIIEPKISNNLKYVNNVTESDCKAAPHGVYFTFDFIKFISDYINFDDIKTIFDIGSRDCMQSLELKKFIPHSKIWAFEGNPYMVDECNRVSSLSNDITVIPKACSNFNGETKFNVVMGGNVGASSLLKVTNNGRSIEWNQTEVTTECIRLDDFMDSIGLMNVDMLWVDVQGAEKIVFDGMGDKIKNVKVINTEVGINQPLYENSIDADELTDYMDKLGFKNMITYYMDGIFENNDEVEIIFINKKLLKL
jgi:FkbM family methyltransferase